MGPASPLLKASDIEVGKSIPVYGREFFIYDCDDATREFYEKFLGKHVEPVVVPDEEKVHLQLLYPPHNGFGGDEDSLGSCLNLRPKPPRNVQTGDCLDRVRHLVEADEGGCDDGELELPTANAMLSAELQAAQQYLLGARSALFNMLPSSADRDGGQAVAPRAGFANH